ncbi:hypothetical protein Ngar_c12110 [Candidatus Nitrososphaera gargensis Ga9.2]|uniref:Uncharacterized protein n=1 Tax=Nitrososphaera gargensis (strain Ga9.2) TaxID=1237085 RepID=K0I9Z9_NITGG|nr:hypothetical protein [Candidatus Nitrososphaera gargensis]AFU58151.1 hypothetical protein Ngar_c12110 [Candidatus Nitrososphaera gargensis Ga9.2]
MGYPFLILMASRKEERKDEAAARQAEAQEVVSRTLDEARDSTKRALEEARRDISARTASFNEYQEQTINAARDIADNYLESQKEIVNSMQSSWVPFIENMYGMYWTGWMSPRRMTEVYARMARNFSDNAISATRMANNMVFANMEAAKASIQYTRDNMRELSRMSINAVKTFEDTSKSYQESMRTEEKRRS